MSVVYMLGIVLAGATVAALPASLGVGACQPAMRLHCWPWARHSRPFLAAAPPARVCSESAACEGTLQLIHERRFPLNKHVNFFK